ncbi:hypothetical protein L2719_13145 [Shewanella schlegeliana]|uniref:Uncharacterized protein n=1 Tax=Shewanella schlegeliana TaxID=190308 RepID=A0ABS1T200_9GAMM|nr:hypothetical protein [Shewanella schlegeliana]MBL4914816.1 hypothetical protein [Shewanella schlegeliana]MCL1110493.1 hypothetical protein [Shewanella schlegeliana]GIU27420.1 hypothetical protein TUM4433_14380 [Shewanella schlegeliana]
MKYLSLLLLLLLTACGGGDSDPTEPQPQKEPHPPMKVADIKQTFSPNGVIIPTIQGQLGKISYQLAAGAPDDVLQISADKRNLTILNAGNTELIATDSGSEHYLPINTHFNITISKSPRQPLVTNDLSFAYQAGERHQANVDGALGDIEYELASAQSDQVVLIEPGGEFLIWGSGSVIIDVTDDGGRNYQADTQQFKITVETAQTEFAQFSDVINKPFLLGAKLLPIYSGTPTQSIHYALVDGANTDVIQIDEVSGEMLVVGAGDTLVEVLQDAPQYHKTVAPQQFKVQINQAENLALQATDVTTTYNEDALQTLAVTGAKGLLSFTLAEGANSGVIDIIDAEKGLFNSIGIGKTQVTVDDTGDKNFLAKTLSIEVEVTRINSDSLDGLDIQARFQANQTIQAQVIGNHGQLTYALADSSPTNVIAVNAATGEITVLKPGTAQVVVKDDGGDFWASQQQNFSVTIDKQVNNQLILSNTRVDYAENAVFNPIVLNNKGDVRFTVDNNGDAVLKQDPDTGIITIIGAGRGWLTALDSGDDYFAPATERFYVDVSPLYGTLSIASVRVAYFAARTLDIPISGSIGELEWQFKHGQSDVITINEAAQTFTINNAGSATYIVTDKGDAGHVSQKAEFNVVIDKAAENTELELSTTLLNTQFADGATLPSPTITGRGVGSEISYYSDLQTSHIASIDPVSGMLSINGAGLTKISVIEQSRNFERTVREFNVNIEKAKHPGLALEANILNVAFYPDRVVKAPAAINQFGKLSYELETVVSPELAELASNGEVTVHTYPKSRENNYFGIVVTDDGGQNYQSSSATYKLFISEIEAGLGEEASVDFNGTDLQIVSPVENAANEVSYFTAFGARGELTNQPSDEHSGGYSTMVAQVCKDPINMKDCTLVTLRLQKTSRCSDGSQVAFPISSKTIYTCPGLSQPISSEVTVSLNKEDAFNTWFTEPGRYQTSSPIVLVHFAKPYRSGGVIEAGDIQSRAWWLINLELTNP